ncbi:MAG: AsmA-like C-terminal region-containing protein [Methylotenera sp.]|nr:AsmA-like C-terminal region-containing protein [Methylotenera sp.]
MDLSKIYTKTPKGAYLRSSLFGGLSSHIKKVLAQVDGISNAGEILSQLNDISESKLAIALSHLEQNGYIKQVVITGWMQVSRFSPMVVEEFSYLEEIEAKSEQENKTWMNDEIKVREVVAQIRAKEKDKAAEKKRIEADLVAREAEEARKKSELESHIKAEEEARQQAEYKLKVEAEARLKAELKMQEDAEKIRIEAEAQAKESERIARELESRQIAEEKARIELELKAKQKVELKARVLAEKNRIKEKAKAEDKERIEDERIAREAEEAQNKSEAEQQAKLKEKIRLEAEHQSKLEAEDRLKAQAEAEKNRIYAELKAKAEEIERIEAERIAHEAEENNKIATAATIAKLKENAQFEVERIAKEKAATQAKLNAEKTSRKEAERISKENEKLAIAIQKKTQQQAEELDRAERKRFAKEVKERKAKINAYAKRSEGARTIDAGKWISAMLKILLLYLPLIALLLVGLLHLINLSMLVNPIEKFVSDSLGEPVTVNEVRASLWPEPHLVLGNVSIGVSPSLNNKELKNTGLKIDSIYIYPVVSTLFENVKVVNSLEIKGMQIKPEDFWLPLRWINHSSKNEHLKIERLNFKKIILKIHDLELTPFDGAVGLSESREFVTMDLTNSDNSLSVQIKPQGQDFSVFLTATKWSLLGIPKFTFDGINAKGTLNQNKIDFGQINGNIYGGSLTAKAVVNWFKPWAVTGSYKLTNASTSQMLRAFGSGGSIDGKLNLEGSFSGKSAEFTKLANETEVIASFGINNGKINGIDLARTAMSRSDKSLAGYATNFDKLTGNLNVKNGHFQFRKLVLKSDQLQAQGNVEIQPNQDISGNISTNLIVLSRRLNARFNLAGNVNNVKQE